MPERFDVGLMRHRVAWQSKGTRVADTMNQLKAPWVDRGDLWARVEPLTGFELVNAKQLRPELSTKVTLRNPGAIKPDHRLVSEGRALNIVFVFRLDERNAYLTLHCTEAAL